MSEPSRIVTVQRPTVFKETIAQNYVITLPIKAHGSPRGHRAMMHSAILALTEALQAKANRRAGALVGDAAASIAEADRELRLLYGHLSKSGSKKGRA